MQLLRLLTRKWGGVLPFMSLSIMGSSQTLFSARAVAGNPTLTPRQIWFSIPCQHLTWLWSARRGALLSWPEGSPSDIWSE